MISFIRHYFSMPELFMPFIIIGIILFGASGVYMIEQHSEVGSHEYNMLTYMDDDCPEAFEEAGKSLADNKVTEAEYDKIKSAEQICKKRSTLSMIEQSKRMAQEKFDRRQK